MERILDYILFATLLAAAVFGISVTGYSQAQSSWAAEPPPINARADSNVWGEANTHKLRLDAGWLLIQNDQEYVYMLVDLVRDRLNDPPLKQAPWGDYISLGFDVDNNTRITPKRDVSFGLYPGSYRMGKQYYLGAGRTTGLQKSRAKLAPGFGSSMNAGHRHRIWEVAIPLAEIGAEAGGMIRFGITTHSQNPVFNYSTPRYFSRDFSKLITVKLHSGISRLTNPVAEKQLLEALQQADTATADTVAQPPQEIERTILADGAVEIRYPDGTVERRFSGGKSIKEPGGEWTTLFYSTQVQPDSPPELPSDQRISDWLENYSNSLMDILSILVANDEASINYYLQKEAESAQSLYDKIYYRTAYIRRLTESN